MPSPIATDDDNNPKKDEDQATPSGPPAVEQDANATPIRKTTSSKPVTPNSAPVGSKSGAKKPEPTLLTDFLLGRPSPARHRRKSLDIVKAEMRQAAVNKVPSPGGVKERVKQWQKTNAAVIVEDPAAAASEPDEILVQVDEESVDEEDRVRIKMRNARPPVRRRSKPQRRGSLKGRGRNNAPRKRVVSDEHWKMKRNTPKSRQTQEPTSGAPIPKDFLKATAPNPPVEVKIKDWMKRAESADGEHEKTTPPTSKHAKVPPSKATSSSSTPRDSPKATAANPPVEDKIKDSVKRTENTEGRHDQATPPKLKQAKVSPSGSAIPKNFLKATATNPSVETKMKDWMNRTDPIETTEVEHDKNTQSRSKQVKDSPSSSNQVKDSPANIAKSKPKQVKDTPYSTTIPKDFLKTTTTNPPVESKIKDWIKRTEAAEAEHGKSKKKDHGVKSTEQTQKKEANGYTPENDPIDDRLGESPVKFGTPSSRSHESHSSTARKDRVQKGKMKEVIDHKSQKQKLKASHILSDFDSDRKSSLSERDSHIEEDATSFRTPSPPEKSKKRHGMKSEPLDDSLSEIPFGHSAFSVLDMPLGAEAGTLKRPKPQRNGSLSVPKVLKKVYNEGLKIVHDTVDPPRVEINQPPSIESWLNQTSDPFVDRPPSSESGPKILKSSSNEPPYHVDDARADPIPEAFTEGSRNYNKLESSRHKSSTQQQRETDSAEKDVSPVVGKSISQSPIDTNRGPSPLSPANLKRSSATRHASTPVKTARKLPFKDVLLDAFKGESAIHGPNPLADLRHPQWEEINHIVSNKDIGEDFSDVSNDDYLKAPPKPELSASWNYNEKKEEDYHAKRNRQSSSTTHRLSTIPSMETINTQSLVSDSGSRRHDSLVKATTTKISRRGANRNGTKRRLTKHSDLLSVLSLPDSAEQGRANSIRSARSIRTTRTDLETATIRGLLRELADDEAKYMRELRTVVDGVIPVLLNMVLSKSSSIFSAEVLNSEVGTATEDKKKLTRDICSMGVALEKLKVYHRRIPLVDVDALTSWLDEIYEIYEDYLSVWRMEFQNVIVNLAPASKNRFQDEQSLLDGMARNADGDVVDSNGERVDVAFLLKRPLVRVKYLSKLTKGLKKLKPSERSESVMNKYDKLHNFARQRIKEENARLEDQAANDIDPTRARDLSTLAQVDGVRIDRFRQVCAKDFFSLDLSHSSGQRMECRVEVILRDKPSDIHDSGDVLICKVEEFSRYLLFPPITTDHITAHHGGEIGHVVFVIRGKHGTNERQETLDLETDDPQTVNEWIHMLASSSSSAEHKATDSSTPRPGNSHENDDALVEMSRTPSVKDVEIPIGERRQKENSRSATKAVQRARDFDRLSKKEKSQQLSTIPETKRANYHTHTNIPPTSLPEEQEQDKYHAAIPNKSAHLHNDHDVVPVSSHLADPETQEPKSYPSRKAARSGSSADAPNLEYHSPHRERQTSPISDYSDLPAPDRAPPPPPPPAHKTPPSSVIIKDVPQLTTPNARVKARRTSSPLKHEYQPSDASGTSSASEVSDSDGSISDDASAASESSDDEELEAVDFPRTLPAISLQARRASPIPSTYSAPEDSLAPSNSASQGPYHRPPKQQSSVYAGKLKARISSWSNKNARWEDLYPEECLIVINPGLIEAFEMPSAHDDTNDEHPLVALVLTPLVSLRQSNAVDIEIKSPPTQMSRLKWDGPIRYRSSDFMVCRELYQAIHRARLDNPIYKKLEQERMVNSYGGHSYEAAVATNRRHSWFGRKRSYRASTRAPEGSVTSSPNSISSSAFSVLKRLTGSSRFDINKSSVDTTQGLNAIGSGHNSIYTSSSGSTASGITPPRTPTSPSLTGTTASHIINRSSENLKIRLYLLATRSKWEDLGSALLTVTQPPPGMRQASSLYQGIERRVVVRTNTKNPKESLVLLDVVLGGRCFQRVGRTGVLVTVWEDITGPNGEIGMIGAVGGVSGRTRKWLLQSGNSSDADWIYGLVAVGQ
ncbi:hypothetical protein B7463_g10770, partial [Scytalidium lignicola]